MKMGEKQRSGGDFEGGKFSSHPPGLSGEPGVDQDGTLTFQEIGVDAGGQAALRAGK